MTSTTESPEATGNPASRACDRWMNKEATDTLEGTEGVHDHYSREVDLSPGQDVYVALGLLEARLMTYRIFPPRVMRAEICSADGRIHEGTTIHPPGGRRARGSRLAYPGG